MSPLNNIFILLARRFSYVFTVDIFCLPGLALSLFYSFLFIRNSSSLPYEYSSVFFLARIFSVVILAFLLMSLFISGGLDRLGLGAFFFPSRRINSLYRKYEKGEEINNDEAVSAMKRLITLPEYSMYISIVLSLFACGVLALSALRLGYSGALLRPLAAGCIMALYLYAVLTYTLADIATYSFRRKIFSILSSRGLEMPEARGFGIRNRIFMSLGFFIISMFSLVYLMSSSKMSFYYMISYFAISALIIVLLMMVHLYPVINVFFNVLETTRRLSRGEDSLLVLGGSEREILNFNTLFNRSMKEFIYLRRKLEVKVKERTDLLEKKSRELHENEENFRIFTDSSNDPIIMMNNDGNISYWNAAAESILGYSSSEMLGRPLHLIIAAKKDYRLFQKRLYDFRRQGEGHIPGRTIELLAIRKSGEEFPAEISIFSFRLEYKWYAMTLLRDITERTRTQQELHEAKVAAEAASLAKSELMARVSQEILTPMKGILGFADLIKRESMEAAIREKADIIRRSGMGLVELVNDIADLSNIDTGKIALQEETVDFHDLMRQIHLLHSITSVNKGLDFRFYIDTDLPRFIISDETKLQHVINRLLSNAVRYTRKGGVQLSAELLSVEDGRVFIKITISDTGIGIPPELHEYVFKNQDQNQDLAVRSFNGSELGLSVLRTFVEMMGGRISMDSSSETGTTFSFFFMALASSGEHASTFSGSLPGVPAGYPRVLIAEGDDYNRLVMEHLLRGRAREIESVKNIHEALDCLSRREFDLAFIDSGLKSSSGRGLVELMRAGAGGDYIRIFGFTGSRFPGAGGEIAEAGFDGFLERPVSKARFIEIMRTLCSCDGNEIAESAEKIPGKHF